MAIKYTSFVADPNIVTGQQLQDYGITTLPEYQATGGSPYLLGQVDEGIQYQTPSYDKYSDLYQYYLGGGFDAEQPDFVTPSATTPVTTGGGGGGAGITAASAVQPTAPVTGGGAQNPLTQMVTNPVTGQTQTVRQAMTSDAAYTGTPTTPIGPRTTLPSGDVFAGGDYSDVAGTLADPTEKIDYTQKDPSFWETAKNKFLATGCLGNLTAIVFFLLVTILEIWEFLFKFKTNVIGPGQNFLYNLKKLLLKLQSFFRS